ncbi:MAG TPA: hypothetical protein VIL48_15140 [Acidimicrobiales bacterium]
MTHVPPPAPAGADPAEPTASGAEADPTATSRAEVAPTATRPEAPRTVRFPFEFDARFVPLALPFGVLPTTAYIEVGDGEVLVRFGPWSLSTPVANVADVTPSGPYRWWKVAGPPRLSLADRGITFATTAAGGLCLRFREPVPAALPTSRLRHPSATVTVATPTALATALGFGDRFDRPARG